LHKEGKLELRCPAKVEKMVFDDKVGKGSSQGASPALLTLVTNEVGTKNQDGSTTTTTPKTETISARLVVAADGGQSPTRKAAGIGTWGWNYAQKAVICTVDVGSDGLLSYNIPLSGSHLKEV
jgi:2-polyprenyl-6-methoxyphenol hydroxylase-like FAD-dependent oxidoreductase